VHYYIVMLDAEYRRQMILEDVANEQLVALAKQANAAAHQQATPRFDYINNWLESIARNVGAPIARPRRAE
jgi:hypothetical protein